MWELETGKCLRVLEGHTADVVTVSVTPDGLRAVSASQDSTLRVWNLETGQCLRVLEGHAIAPKNIIIMPDGLRAVSASWDQALRVWDLETGQCLWVLEGEVIDVLGVTPDGLSAVLKVITDEDYELGDTQPTRVQVREFGTGKCLRELEPHPLFDRGATLTPVGKWYMIGAGADKTLRVWDLKTGRCVSVVCLPAEARSLVFSSKLGRVFAGTITGQVLQFELRGIS